MPACRSFIEGRAEMVFKYHAKYNKRVKGIQLWTHENHAFELSDNHMTDSRMDYLPRQQAGIHENPIQALYSSARNYSG